MKNLACGLVLSLGVLLMTGCTTYQTARIRQSPELFGSLPAGQQKLIEAGKVKVGFTADMVYLALGNPDKVLKFKGPNSEVDTWVYRRVARADRMISGSFFRVSDYTYDRRGMLLPSSDSIFFDHNGMIQAGPYDHDSLPLNGIQRIQTLSLIFRSGKIVGIMVVG